jgi:hypothetical protein
LGHTQRFINIDANPTVETAHKLWVSVNNQNFSPRDLYVDMFFEPAPADHYLDSSTNGDILPVKYGGVGGFYEPFTWSGRLDGDFYPRRAPACPNVTLPDDTTVEPWKFAISGYRFAIPTQQEPQFMPGDLSGAFAVRGLFVVPLPSTIELYAVSVWFGISDDVSQAGVRALFLGPDGKFIPPKSDGQDGRPLGAHAFYGEPSLYFTGGKTAFPKNKGLTPPTAPDSYTASASGINNYSPAPRKAGEFVGI